MASKIIHVEVVGRDGAKLQAFYRDLFGWDLDTNNPGGYGLMRDGEMTAGIGATQDGEPGHVTFYVHADDAAATLERAEQLGGKVIMPLTEVAPETNVALFTDPEGHIIGLM